MSRWTSRAVAVLLAAACGGDTLEPGPVTDGGALVVSEAAGAAGATVTWVSLPPGAVPGGTEARVRLVLAGGRVVVPVTDGGFDPLAVPAAVGDTVVVEVWGEAGVLATLRLPVPVRVPPVVVRTVPPKKKVDVPINLQAVVVFSEPLDPVTVTTGTVRLLRGGEVVAGTVMLNAEGWQAVIVPDVALKPLTGYALEVTTGVRDLAGDGPTETLRVEFTTGAAPPAVAARVDVVPDTVAIMVGTQLVLTARVTDAFGNPLARPLTWQSSSTAVATVDYGTVTAVGAGEAVISATADGVTGVAQVRVTTFDARSLALGEFHTCALDVEGRTYCWGNDFGSHLGTRPNETCLFWVNNDPSCLTVPSLVPGAPAFTSLTAGEFHTCGLTAAGTAYCWGVGDFGQLGDGRTDAHTLLTPTAVTGSPVFKALTAGAAHTCGLTPAGEAYCWGSNSHGQLGDNSGTSQGSPVRIRDGPTFVVLAAFWRHTCGVDDQGWGWCWGDNGDAQLGTGSLGGMATVPVPVTGGLRFATIEPGFGHTCAITAGGIAYCWGTNGSGTLGIGSDQTSQVATAPVAVATSQRFASLHAGDEMTCALGATDRAAYCWGRREPSGERDLVPTAAAPVAGLPFTVLGVGRFHACGITPDYWIHCWGDDSAGQTRPFKRDGW